MKIDVGLCHVVLLVADANSIVSVAHKKPYINAVDVHYRPEDTHEHDFCGTVKVATTFHHRLRGPHDVPIRGDHKQTWDKIYHKSLYDKDHGIYPPDYK